MHIAQFCIACKIKFSKKLVKGKISVRVYASEANRIFK